MTAAVADYRAGKAQAAGFIVGQVMKASRGQANAALVQAGISPGDLAACGIASQRGTDFVWDASTGLPLANAITWQDLRTQSLERELRGWLYKPVRPKSAGARVAPPRVS